MTTKPIPDPAVSDLIARYAKTWTALRRHDEGVPPPLQQQATQPTTAPVQLSPTPSAEGALQQRLAAVAQQAQANGEDVVTALRREIGLPPRQAVAIEDLPADMVKALHEAVATEPEADGLDHLLEGGEWSPAAKRLLAKPSLKQFMLAAGTEDGPDPADDAFDRALASMRGRGEDEPETPTP